LRDGAQPEIGLDTATRRKSKRDVRDVDRALGKRS